MSLIGVHLEEVFRKGFVIVSHIMILVLFDSLFNFIVTYK